MKVNMDRLPNLLLLLLFVAFFGVVTLATYSNGGSYGQVWAETKKLMAESQDMSRKQAIAEVLPPSASDIPPVLALYLADQAKACQQIDWRQKIQSAQTAVEKFCGRLGQALLEKQKSRQRAAVIPIIRKPHELFPILAQVESENNPRKIGDNGRAVGVAQIWKCVVDDANRIMGERKFRYCDRKSVNKSREIFAVYVEYYGNRYQRKTGRQPTAEIWSRIWNGGPEGWQKAGTKDYWLRVSDQFSGSS